MAQGNPMPGEKYLHFKNRLYQVIAVAYHSETMEPYVVYQALYGDFKTYIRPYDMFVSEVDHEKYPEVRQRYRFQYKPDTDSKQSLSDNVCTSGEGAEKQASQEYSEAGNAVEPAKRTEQRPKKVLKVLKSEDSVAAATGQKADGSAEGWNADSTDDESEAKMNPWLEKFLDAKGFEEKYRIVCDMQGDITDRLIDDIAVVMDLAIPEGDLKERYAQLKYCMRTRQKYEMGRLR